MGVFMLGLPIGLVLAYFTVGPLVHAFESWRAPFFIAMLPGLALAAVLFLIDEPARGAAEAGAVAPERIRQPIRKVLRIRTMWWVILAGTTVNVATYAANAFMVPMLQRYFRLDLTTAAAVAGVILGLSGLVGLTAGGVVADWMHRSNERARLAFGAASLVAAAVLTWIALTLGRGELAMFTAVFAVGWLLQYNFFTCVYPAIQDVVDPRMRSTAMAIYLAALYLLGGAGGPVIVGLLSDRYAAAAMAAAGASAMQEEFKAVGLHGAMVVVPVALLLSGIAIWLATRTFPGDAAAMRRAMTELNARS
jgi:MFS family permease